MPTKPTNFKPDWQKYFNDYTFLVFATGRIYNIHMKYFQDSLSTQIIIPQKQIGRKSDIYVTMVSTTNQVASKGWFVAMISTTVETDNPEAEIQPGLNLLGPIKQKFFQVFKFSFKFDENLMNPIAD